MTDKQSISLKEAREKFKALLATVGKKDVIKFVELVYEELAPYQDSEFLFNNVASDTPVDDDESEGSNKDVGLLDDPMITFDTIAEEIMKERAILYSEKKASTKKPDFDYDQDIADDESEGSHKDIGLLDDPITTLNTIAEEIKKKVPVSAILSSEKIASPKKGEHADCLSDITVHVDEFLYDDDDIEQLVDDGLLKRNYCLDCKSRNIEPLIFISHSMSRKALYYVFNDRLPTLENKIVLDVGSRLGAVLYGAYVLTDASRIIGVEMNEDLCKLQNQIVEKFELQDRIKVLCQRIEESDEVVKSADVILINNAFEFYVSEEKQIEIWRFLKGHIKSKSILVTRPPLETTFKNLNTGIDLTSWVKPYRLNGEEIDPTDAEEFCDLEFYEIL